MTDGEIRSRALAALLDLCLPPCSEATRLAAARLLLEQPITPQAEAAPAPTPPPVKPTPEDLVLTALAEGTPFDLDGLALRAGIPAADLAPILDRLEAEGKVRSVPCESETGGVRWPTGYVGR